MTTRKPRLNKEHGFLKCIIRNQIERDEYEKALSSQTKEERDREYKAKQVDEMKNRNVYIPPHLRTKSGSTTPEQSPSPQMQQQSSSDEENKDPHVAMRERARKKLIREGVLKQQELEQQQKLASLFNDLDINKQQ